MNPTDIISKHVGDGHPMQPHGLRTATDDKPRTQMQSFAVTNCYVIDVERPVADVDAISIRAIGPCSRAAILVERMDEHELPALPTAIAVRSPGIFNEEVLKQNAPAAFKFKAIFRGEGPIVPSDTRGGS